MSWKEIGKALNDTLARGRLKPLNKIIEAESYNSYYNTMLTDVTAFGDNSGAIAVLPFGITETGTSIRGNTTVKSVVVPMTVKTISEDAFAGCTALESIVIPPSVEYIGRRAFQGCDSLKNIFLPLSINTVMPLTFSEEMDIDVYVEWSEGDIVGAPWGAKSGRIHYDAGVTM